MCKAFYYIFKRPLHSTVMVIASHDYQISNSQIHYFESDVYLCLVKTANASVSASEWH